MRNNVPVSRPRRMASTHVEVLDGELCIYEWTSRTVHALNPPAARVWERCDGQTTIAEMADALRLEFREPHAEDIVGLALRDFRDAGLLEDVPLDLPGLSRRELVRTLAATSAIPVLISIVAPTPLAAQSAGNSRTFEFEGSPRSFIVPVGVTSLTVDVHGASGAGFGAGGLSPVGLRGRVQATLAVTPGEMLTIIAGGVGSLSGTGGFGGGGAAGAGGAYGGGGSSDIRTALFVPLIIAGGAGGAGSFTLADFGASGGHGGGLTGVAGGATPTGASGGGGGTQSAGGAGGTGVSGGQVGASGVLYAGGNGGDGLRGGGGGGGGFYGGGGGGGNNAEGGNSGGGGGGSSFADSLRASGVVHTQGAGSGTGLVVVSW